MGKGTKIQWCDDTVNPVMGCGGCELFPKPGVILRAIDDALLEQGVPGWQREFAEAKFEGMIDRAYRSLIACGLEPGVGHLNKVTTTNIWHLRKQFVADFIAGHGEEVGRVVRQTIERHVTCYAAKLHLDNTWTRPRAS